MKKIILPVLLCFTIMSVKAQLTNTKWKVALNIPDSTDVVFNFKTDTVVAVSTADSQSLETMVYTLQDTILTLKKVEGKSECDDTVVGKYKLEMKDNGMYVTLIEDSCADRANVLNNNTKWTKIE